MDDLNRVIAEALQIPVESVPDDGSTETIPGWDSLGHLTLVTALEGRYAVHFTLDEMVAIHDVPTIRRILKLRGAS